MGYNAKVHRSIQFRGLREKLLSIDKSTISRIIHLFNDNGLIHKFDDGSGSVKYSVCQEDCGCSEGDYHYTFTVTTVKRHFVWKTCLFLK